MLNRRGHIATWLILLGALILMVTAWFTFLSFDGNVVTKADTLHSAILVANEDRYYIQTLTPILVTQSALDASENFEQSFRDILRVRAERIALTRPLSGNFFTLIQTDDYTLSSVGNSYTFRMRGIVVERGVKDHITQTFDLEVNFTRPGVTS